MRNTSVLCFRIKKRSKHNRKFQTQRYSVVNRRGTNLITSAASWHLIRNAIRPSHVWKSWISKRRHNLSNDLPLQWVCESLLTHLRTTSIIKAAVWGRENVRDRKSV